MTLRLSKTFNPHALALASCLCALGCVSLVHAQAALPAAAAADATQAAAPVKFSIRGFTIKGENPLPSAETTALLAQFLRRDADIDVLQQATTALETRLRERGFGLHRVALPPQEIGETVALEIVKFTINQVNIERLGDDGKPQAAALKRFTDANVLRSLPELQPGATPNFKTLAVQTALANDSAAKQVSVSLRESEQADKIDATVRVRENRPWWASVSASNTGNPSSGSDRITFSAAHANLFDRDHQLAVSLTTSAERTHDVKQLGLNYRAPLYAQGAVLGLTATKSNVIGNFGVFTSTGAGGTWGINYSKSLPPEGGHKANVSLSLDNKRFNVAEINGIPSPGQLMRRSLPLTLGYSARNESDERNWAYSLDLSSNLRRGSGNDLLSYQSEDPRVSTANFQVLRASVNYLRPLFDRKWTLGVRSQLQWAPNALISGEQFGIGGTGSVRGTSERPISGDKGFSVSTELNSPELFAGFRVLGFVDMGYLTNVVSNNATKLASDKLASAGLGMRYYSPAGLSLSLDYGRITTGSAVPLSIVSSSPQRGDEKMHLNASFRY